MPAVSTHKTCTVCKLRKPLRAFYKSRTCKNGRGPRCTKCFNSASWQAEKKRKTPAQLQAKWRKARESAGKDKLRERQRKIKMKCYYGITPRVYQILLRAQQGACAICKRVPKATLCIDHCHKTKVVRGLLCRSCNSAIGLLQDDSAVLLSAAEYVKKEGVSFR